MVVIGAGYIGLEMGTANVRLGTKVKWWNIAADITWNGSGSGQQVQSNNDKTRPFISYEYSCEICKGNKDRSNADLVDAKSHEETEMKCDIALVSVGVDQTLTGLVLRLALR